jgi:hypothetical protein
MIDNFSDRENGLVARTEEVITPPVWAASRPYASFCFNVGVRNALIVSTSNYLGRSFIFDVLHLFSYP